MATKETLVFGRTIARREVGSQERLHVRTAYRQEPKESLVLENGEGGVVWVRYGRDGLSMSLSSDVPSVVSWPGILPFLKHRVILDQE